MVLGMLLWSGVVGAQRQPDLRTTPERTAFEETSRYDDVRELLNRLAEASPLVHLETFGRSEEGRELPLVAIASPPVSSAAAALRDRRVRVLVLGNIHAGEVEGKEAALILARRLSVGDLRPLLRRVIVLVAPIYNADGNERIAFDHRPEQFGPVSGVGIRENAKGLDLNRDFIKLETAESRSLVRLLTAWDPHVVIDLHTTNGSYHGYHLTYAPSLAVNADPRLVRATRTLLDSVSRVLIDRGWRTYYYGNFSTEGGLDRERERPGDGPGGAPAWRTFDARPRFVTNGVGLRNRMAILSEAYSYLSFERRIQATGSFLETLIALIARRPDAIRAATTDLDRAVADAGAHGTLGPLGLGARLVPEATGAVPILVGDVDHRTNPRSGRIMTTMIESAARPVLMQDYGSFEPLETVAAPRAYAIPAGTATTALIERVAALLAAHGVQASRLTGNQMVGAEAAVPGHVVHSDHTFQGHLETRLEQLTRRPRRLSLPAGSLWVPLGQPLARLVFQLLEPASDDGVVTWNVLDPWLHDGEDVPIYRILGDR